MERDRILRWLGLVLGLVIALALLALALVCGGLWGVGAAWNAGAVEVDEIGPDWTVAVDWGEKRTGPAPAIAQALETQCSPSTNGLRVLFAHLWYNAITDGYDAEIWLDDQANYGSYALYVSGHQTFLRDEVGRGGYRNRVLSCELDAEGWKALAGAGD